MHIGDSLESILWYDSALLNKSAMLQTEKCPVHTCPKFYERFRRLSRSGRVGI